MKQASKLTFLGEGLNGSVYRQRKTLGRNLPTNEIAIKIFKNHDELKAFERRFQDLIHFRSRYCASFLGWELLDNRIAVAMDYIDGVSLYEVSRSAHLTSEIKVEIMAQLQNGVRELHSAGICHGDLSFSNIMIDIRGQLKLIDFGLGKSSKKDRIIGTPKYLSPERWNGDAVTIYDDIFSVGLLYLELTASTNEVEDYYKKRAQRLSIEDGPWFHSTPALRRWEPSFKETTVSRKKLKDLVVSLKKSSLSDLARTQIVRANDRRMSIKLSLFRLIAGILILFLPPLTLGRGFGGQQIDIPGEKQYGFLEVKTQKWFEIWIDDQPFGYSPVYTRPLEVGFHKVTWRNQSERKSLTVVISAGRKRVLKDSDFE